MCEYMIYELDGNNCPPCLTVLAEEERLIGVWGLRHKRYLKGYHPTFNALLLSGKLNVYLAGIDWQEQELLDTIIQKMAGAMEVVNREIIDK